MRVVQELPHRHRTNLETGMDDKYKNIGEVEDRLIEECSELIQSICKAKRFGWDNFHPDRPNSNNYTEFFNEFMDVTTIGQELKNKLYKKYGPPPPSE